MANLRKRRGKHVKAPSHARARRRAARSARRQPGARRRASRQRLFQLRAQVQRWWRGLRQQAVVQRFLNWLSPAARPARRERFAIETLRMWGEYMYNQPISGKPLCQGRADETGADDEEFVGVHAGFSPSSRYRFR